MSSIGDQLRQARETRKLTIKQAVIATRVRAHYLQYMEADDFNSLPSPAQARGFLRLYADYLGLNSEELVNLLRAETNPEPPTPANPAEEPPQPAPAAPPEPEPQPAPLPEPEIIQAPAPVPAGPAPVSKEIFKEIGAQLRERRELISLTLEEVERHTRVRKHNLEYIETGEFDALPSPVQARGILNAYASFMDMDTEQLLLRYADALQSRRLERQPTGENQAAAPRRGFHLPLWVGRFISPDLIFGGGMIIIMLGLSIWGATRILSSGAIVESTPTQGPSISDVLLATSAVNANATNSPPTTLPDEKGTRVPTQDPGSIVPTDTLAPTVPSAVQVTIVILQRTFLRVIVDGTVKQDGRVSVGAALTFEGNDRVEVLTGSGAAIQVIFNQGDQGVMGSLGEVVDRIYTIQGVQTPTPTPSPTPTITVPPSPTSKPTLTPRPSATPRPTSTLIVGKTAVP